MATMTPHPARRWQEPAERPTTPASTDVSVRPPQPAAAHDLRGGLVTLLGSVYIVILIPMILGAGVSPSPFASISATAFACAVGTAVFAVFARLPLAVGPGIVPASMIATFVASGIPFRVVLGIEVLAGALFVALAATGAIQGWVRRMPPVLKTAGQIAIGLYLLLAALRATGILQPEPGAAAPGREALLFLVGVAVVLLLHRSKRLGGYALLLGIGVATAGAAGFGMIGWPGTAFEAPQPALFRPDPVAAFAWRYLDEILVLLYVVVVDVVATLETIANCAPALRGRDGRLRHFDLGLMMSAVVFVVGPFLGTAPMLVLFESLGGVMSGARTHRAAIVCALGFLGIVFVAPLAGLVPAFACAVALAYIGTTITGVAAASLPQAAGDATAAQIGWQLAAVALLTMIVANSIALTVFALFVAYPVIVYRAGQQPRAVDLAAASACVGMIAMGLP
jgi:AGZA family xanthine/uracil permease-like MFS transporter